MKKVMENFEEAETTKEYDNLLQQDLTAEKPNQKWCTDFTYLFLKNGGVCCNCTILDSFNCNVVASITYWNVTSGLAVRILQKALDSQQVKVDLILHSN